MRIKNLRDNIKFCPRCESEEIVMIVPNAGLWKCVNCGYQTTIFPEKSIIKKNLNKKQNE